MPKPNAQFVDTLGRPYHLAYDAVTTGKRRKAPSTILKSEDDTLPRQDRKRLVSTTRDLYRNFVAPGWAVRRHLDYTTSYTFQARTGDDGLNKKIEELIAWWSRPKNCDIAGRHSLGRMVRLAEMRRIIDGDIFFLKLSSGHVQAIEGDRVRFPTRGPFGTLDRKRFTHGVELDSRGRTKSLVVCKRVGGQFVLDRVLNARWTITHSWYDRLDQVRGVSPMAPAINTYRDLYEGLDYHLAKMKVAAMFGLAIYREGYGSIGDVTGSGADADSEPYNVDFGAGPQLLDLDPGDRAEFLEAKTPPAESREFTAVMIGLGLKALDIPFSFYDEAYTNYSGARQAMLLYELSAGQKRDDVRGGVLDNLTRWRLGKFIADGVLVLPGQLTLPEIKYEWVARGLPWIDPLKEVAADVKAVDAGLTSRQRVLKRQGLDFDEVADELQYEQERLAKGEPTATGA